MTDSDEQQQLPAAAPADLVPSHLPDLAMQTTASAPELEDSSGRLEGDPAPISVLHDVKVTVQVVLGGLTMPIAELLDLRGGSVIELDRRVGEPVDMVVNGRTIARGELVLIDGSLGLTLTEIVRPER